MAITLQYINAENLNMVHVIVPLLTYVYKYSTEVRCYNI